MIPVQSPTVDLSSPQPADRSARSILRYTRIAFAGTSAAVWVLLVVLWVRSHWYADQIVLGHSRATGRMTVVESARGNVRSGNLPGSVGFAFDTDELSIFSTYFDHPNLTRSSVVMPYWVLTAIATACAALPWLPIRRFSLRALFIVLTVIGLILGLLIYTIR